VQTLNEIIPFNFEFDTTKSSGYPKRVMDISLAKEKLDYEPNTSLKEGLLKTWIWFTEHADEFKLKKDYFK
jgi:GDP-L-fucose synthase